MNLTGTHIGCDTSQCGACVVHVDGKSVKSCTLLVADIDGSKVTTIEGLSQNGELHQCKLRLKNIMAYNVVIVPQEWLWVLSIYYKTKKSKWWRN